MLQLTDVWKSYDGKVDVLRGVSLAVEEGEGVFIFGENGSGKTTLLNVAGGLDAPSKGGVAVGGRDLAGMREGELAKVRRDAIGFVFQDHNLIEELTVLQNVMLPLRLAGAERPEARATEVLESFGIAALAPRHPMEISTGQRQLAAVARAFANGPRVVLADEPTASLDEANGRLVHDALRRANREMGAAVVITRHHGELDWTVSKRFGLREGRLQPA